MADVRQQTTKKTNRERGGDRPASAGYRCDSAIGKDQLGIDGEAEAFARLIMDHKIRPPLSVGLWGDWGSGKSFFMERILAMVTTLQGKPGQCERVAQVKFNAWHFSDANLWASLVTHIFDEIWRQVAPPNDDDHRAGEQLRKQLEQAEGAVREAGTRLEGARKAVERAERQLSHRQQQLALEAYVDATRCDRLEAIARAVGWGKPLKSIAEVRAALAELRAADGRLSRLLGAGAPRPPHPPAPPRILLSVLVGAGLTVAAQFQGEAWVKHALHSLGLLGGLVASAVSAVAAPLRQAASGLTGLADDLEKVQTDYDAGLKDAKNSDDAKLREEAEARQKAERELQSAEAGLAAAQKNLSSLLARQNELNPARRLGAFLAERAASADYRSRQGIVSLVRQDFEKLSKLMEDWRLNKEKPPDGVDPVDRIVLYVDDLDRCPPAQVVQALEAIHLLLALDLFVVVVAVDSRWLLRSLAVHYKELLNAGTAEELTYRESTPQNYLEKIFQVTYALAPMEKDYFDDYVEHLAAPAEEEAPAIPEVEAEQPRPLIITGDEQEFLTSLLPLIPTPRAAKRLVNVYRLVKARVATADLPSFEDPVTGRCRPVLLLLALLFGRPGQAEELLRRLAQKEPPFQTPKLQLHMAVKNLAQAEGQNEQVHDDWIQLSKDVNRIAGDLLVEQCTEEAGELARFSLVTGQSCHLW